MKFLHPGTTMSPAMTRALQKDAFNDPLRKQAYTKYLSECPLTYKPRALPIIDLDWGGVGKGHEECTKDGEMAFRAAILYWCNMDPSYGKLAANIIKAWSTTNKVFKGNNAPLEAAWSVCAMARAAELVKYAGNGVGDYWKHEVEAPFFKWLDTVIAPVLRTPDLWKWNPKGNWHFSIICARAQIAILREDIKEWEWCKATYLDILPSTFCFKGHECHISETCRDVTHAQFQLGGIIQFPEMVFHQENLQTTTPSTATTPTTVTTPPPPHLFPPKLIDVFEYHARILLKEVPSDLPSTDIHTPYGYWYEPIWEMAYTRLTKITGRPMPKTEQFLKTFRPERITFHWGAGTLTHYNR